MGLSPRMRGNLPEPAIRAPALGSIPAHAGKPLAEFGVDKNERFTLFKDVTHTYLAISEALFRARSGDLKLKKRGRQKFILLMADTIKDPAEIWEGWSEWGDRQVLRRRYLGRFVTPAKDIDVVTVFETGAQGWVGVTAFGADQKSLLQSARHGKRVYQRGDK